MELKRILARDSRSANEKAIQLYGSDVLIISSQRLDNQTELIVATDVQPLEPEAPQGEPPKVDTPATPRAQTPFVPFAQWLDEANARQGLDTSDEAAPGSQPTMKAQGPGVQPGPAGLQPQPRLGSQPMPPATSPVSAHESQRSLEIVDMLRMEVASLRKEFALSRQMRPWQDSLGLSPEIEQLSQAMNDAGVPAALRALLTDSIRSLDKAQEAMPVMQDLLVTAIARAACGVWPSAAHALCGPSGSGKTSMVGRLAHAAAQQEGVERHAMVSFADQRPGAWAQMQLLASQSGVACYRAADAAMLRTLLEDLQGKTVWIDTCGADFGVQAELLRQHCPQVLRHAVLPVDATVTSVQKILDNPTASWTSLMLTKVDEAAHPWPLLKGLTENSLPVSWVAGDSRISTPAQAFDPSQLVRLALAPLGPLTVMAPLDPVTVVAPVAKQKAPKAAPRPKRAAQAITPAQTAGEEVAAPRSRAASSRKANTPVSNDIVIPTLMGAKPAARPRGPSKSTLSA